MATMLRIVSTLFVLALGTCPAPAQETPRWSQGMHARARLIAGGQDQDELIAGLEIELDSGFKTYWRTPGNSGLPPRFDWSASDNVSTIELRWPAPSRMEDSGGVAYVYSHKVVLPVVVKARDPSQPVKLGLSVDYGICKDICIPAHADLRLDLDGKSRDRRAAIDEALAQVPSRKPLGASGPLAILSASRIAGERPSFTVRTRFPAGSHPVLFAEGPENWYLSASPADGEGHFTVTVEEKPDGATDAPIILTLKAGEQAVETQVRLDAGPQPR